MYKTDKDSNFDLEEETESKYVSLKEKKRQLVSLCLVRKHFQHFHFCFF